MGRFGVNFRLSNPQTGLPAGVPRGSSPRRGLRGDFGAPLPFFFPFFPSFLEQLHKQQGAVLHPDYKSSFRSFEDALQRLLPYHVYQGMLPSPQDYRKGERWGGRPGTPNHRGGHGVAGSALKMQKKRHAGWF